MSVMTFSEYNGRPTCWSLCSSSSSSSKKSLYRVTSAPAAISAVLTQTKTSSVIDRICQGHVPSRLTVLLQKCSVIVINGVMTQIT